MYVGSGHQEGLHIKTLVILVQRCCAEGILHRHTHSGAIRNLYSGSCLVGKAAVTACRVDVIALKGVQQGKKLSSAVSMQAITADKYSDKNRIARPTHRMEWGSMA